MVDEAVCNIKNQADDSRDISCLMDSGRITKGAITAERIRAYTPTCQACGCITASIKCERCGHDTSNGDQVFGKDVSKDDDR